MNTRNPQPTTIDRVDPGDSFERRRAAMRASWTPEVHEFAAVLAEEIDFARRLREFREVFSLTQRQVAEITGEDQGDVSRLERRELNPSQERMNRILGRLRDYVDNLAPQTAERPRVSNSALTTAKQAAAYLCAIRDEADREFRILKLQKLLYYAQGMCLALRHQPLFPERIKAWEHGPVIPQIWKDYEGQGNLPRPNDLDLLAVDPEVAAILDRVYAEYGQYAAWALRNMTHQERPWVETARNEEIDRQLMAEFFEERLRIGESRRAPATS